MPSPSFFWLGITGYIGSQFLASALKDPELYAKLKEFTLVALVRDPEGSKAIKLRELWPGIVLIKGTVDDTSIIEEQAEKAALVFNSALAEHDPSVKAIISGLQKRSAGHPDERQPLYIHTSGLGITSDNSRGEYVPDEEFVRYSDSTFKLDLVPATNRHQNTDRLIYAAGTQKENPIRTIMVYPMVVYGFGEGVTPLSPIYRVFPTLFIKSGIVGTWGPGFNKMGVVHIKDVGSAFTTVFKLALEGKAKEKEKGFYFINSEAEPLIFKQFAGGIGRVLHSSGLIQDPEVKPFPEAVTAPFGEVGWSAFGGNAASAIPANLKEAGWEATETRKVGLLESLPLEVATFVEEHNKSV